MSYEDTLRRLGGTTEKSVLSVWAQHRAGELTLEQARGMIEVLLSVANVQGQAFGELSFQSFMEIATGLAKPVAGAVTAANDTHTIMTAASVARALSKAPEQVETALSRVAFNSPVRYATESFRSAMIRDGRSDTYTRGLEAGACTLCFYLYKNGYPYPVEKQMHRHPGCVCSQIPNVRNPNGQADKRHAAAAAAAEQRYELGE